MTISCGTNALASTIEIEQAYERAREQYAELGVDTARALEVLRRMPVSVHCWQGDDVRGFENSQQALGGGLAVTGDYPGKARTPDELRSDLQQAISLIPGKHRINLHASYGETNGHAVDRDQLAPEHFVRWIDWAKEQQLALDFNPTFFSHPQADSGFTLAHADKGVRQFWVEHGKRCREIAAVFGQTQGSPCVLNFWVPDGYKDTPVDRRGPRERLADSLDSMFATDFDTDHLLDSVESKLFGIGSESYVVGSHEFYLGYAIRRNKMLCLDSGHFHPTETISDKISAVLTHLDEILLHVSRGVRWDSDHVVTYTDDLQAIANEVVRGNYLKRVHVALDFFDASINRVAAWTIGTRATCRAFLQALLEPQDLLRGFEAEGDFTSRLAFLEELKNLPANAVWDYHCLTSDVPVGPAWLEEVRRYEVDVLSQR